MRLENEVPGLERDISGRGEPLLLMPGGLTGWLSWKPHAEALAHSRTVIRLQTHIVALGLAGVRLPSTYSVAYEVAALRNTLDELALPAADFAAWSYGGEITLSFAIHHPERVRSLTLIEPSAYWVLRSRGPLPEALLEEQRSMQTLAVEDVSAEQVVHFLQTVSVVPEDVDPRALPQWPVWFEHRQSLRMGDAPYQHGDNIHRVRAFTKPVLLVKGEGSSPFLHDIIDVLVEELPNTRVVTFPGGHAAHIVSRESFMERFTRFLSERN